MDTLQSQSRGPVGIRKVSGTMAERDGAFSAVLRDVLQTREARQFIITVVPEFFNAWAGRSWWKRKVSKMAGLAVNSQLSRPGDALETNELERLLGDEEFIRNVCDLIPPVVNAAMDAMCTGIRNLEGFPAEEKKEMLEKLLSHKRKGQSGALLTHCARILNDIHKVDPEFLARTLEPGITRWLESTDFGELKEAVDNSEQDALALVAMINRVIWQYPTKVISIFSLLPSLANMAMGAVEISGEKLNAIPPDMLTDIIIALLDEIDGRAVAGLVGELMEIGRKLHTGSALIGEPGSPQLPKSLAVKMEEIVSRIDAVTFWKGRLALAEVRDAFHQALVEAVGNDADHARLAMAKGPELYNIGVRGRNRKLASIEAMEDAVLEKTMQEYLTAYDVQQTAELFNNFLRIANRVWVQNPVTCYEFISQFVNAIDMDELDSMSKQIFQNMGEELRPMARAVVPGLVTWVCDVLRPEGDEYEGDAARARESLQSLFMPEEV